MKQKLMLAGLACVTGVTFAQLTPPGADPSYKQRPDKQRPAPNVDAHKWRSHEAIKGTTPAATPGVRASGPEEEPTQARLQRGASVKPGGSVATGEEEGIQPRARAAGKPLTPQGPLAMPSTEQKPAPNAPVFK
jgi:hypothetical protein